MELKNIILLIVFVIFLIEYVLKHHKFLFLIITCSILLFFIYFLIRNLTLKGRVTINDFARILKILMVQFTVVYIYILTYYKIDNDFHNRNIYYLIIFNILIISVFEFDDINDFNTIFEYNDKHITKIISGILIIILAVLTPKQFGIHDNIYGFKDNLIWVIVAAILLNNYYLGNRKWDDKIKYVIPVLIAIIIPLFAQLITNNSWLIYRAVCLSIVFTLLEYDTHFFYNTYEEKLKEFYLTNEYSFIGVSILSVLLLLYTRLT